MFEGYNYVEKDGRGAAHRFSTPEAIRTVFAKLRDDDVADARRRANILKLYNGNLPYDPRALAECGLKNLTNVNFCGLKGVIDERSDAILKLESDTVNLIELRPIARELAGPDADRIAGVVASEFSTMVRDGGRFIPALARMNKEADLYGLGPVTWTSPVDYCPVSLNRGQVRFVSNGPVESSLHEVIMFETTIPAAYLRALLDSPDEAAAEGWDVKEVAYWLREVYLNGKSTKEQPGTEGSTTPLESVITMLRSNMLGEEQQFEDFHVIHAYVKEVAWPRGITHYIIPSVGEGDSGPKPRFLFEKVNAARTMDGCFLWYPYSVKEQFAREVRGIASFLYPIDKLNNRYMCQIADAGSRAASLILSRQAATTGGDLTVTEQGPYVMLPPGVTLAGSQLGSGIQGLVAVKQLLDQAGAASVTGNDKPLLATAPKLFNGPAQTQTKAEIELQQHVRSHRSEAEFSQRMVVLNKIFHESFVRVLRILSLDPFTRSDYPEVEEFMTRCLMRGVTPDQIFSIPKLYSVVTCRDLALGADGKAAELDAFVQLYGGSLDEAGRRYVARCRAVLRFGVGEADRIAPELSRDSAPNDQSSLATVENGIMRNGGQALVGADQWHWSHIPVHAQILQEIVEAVRAPQDGTGGSAAPSGSVAEDTLRRVGDPRSALKLLTECSQHIQEHLQYGARQIGMEASAKQVMKMIADLRPTVKALNLAVATQERVEQAQQEKAAREQQALREAADGATLKAGMHKAELDAQVAMKRAEYDHDVALRKLAMEAQAGQHRQAIDDGKAAADSARADREAAARAGLEKQVADAKTNAAAAANRMDVTSAATGHPQTPPSSVVSMGPAPFASM